jgi:hypothetical protein
MQKMRLYFPFQECFVSRKEAASELPLVHAAAAAEVATGGAMADSQIFLRRLRRR